jgi:DNA (cytosine-5)-methyltransferase 1
MTAYYNEYDPNVAAWLRELVKGKHLADGIVDSRSIHEIEPKDLKDFTHCHFFAGIGVWAYAAEQAGWPEDRPLWTGSCPCQPFSVAGQGKQFDDHRHLWPVWFNLIAECRPDTVFGEQVATEAGRIWLSHVVNDMGRQGYAVGSCSTNALYFGAPHRRQRTYFVGHANGWRQMEQAKDARRAHGHASAPVQDVADANPERLEGAELLRPRHRVGKQPVDRRVAAEGRKKGRKGSTPRRWDPKRPWAKREWLDFEDPWTKEECQRPVEPGTLPLAYRTPSDVGRLRGYGNALCAPQAIGFIEAFMEAA